MTVAQKKHIRSSREKKAAGKKLRSQGHGDLSNFPRKVGRPRGKKSDPEFVSTTIYIRKTTRKTVKHLLIEREDHLDLSGVVEQQLSLWANSQK